VYSQISYQINKGPFTPVVARVTASTVRLVAGLLWLIAHDYYFFSAMTYSTGELLVEPWAEPLGIFPTSGTRAFHDSLVYALLT
jgi:hypothetical protein